MPTPSFVQQSLKTTTTNALLTAPGQSQCVVMKASVVNNDSSSRGVTAYIVPSGASVGTSTIVINNLAIANGQTQVLPISGQALTGNAGLYMKCSVTNKCTVSITYLLTP